MSLNTSIKEEEEDEGDFYYKSLMAKVDSTIEETKKERDRKLHDMEIRDLPNGNPDEYEVDFFLHSITPAQALVYMSDPENLHYFNPRITLVKTEVEEEDEEGLLYLDLKVRVVAYAWCCSSPLSSSWVRVQVNADRKRHTVEVIERMGRVEKMHKYTIEEESKGCRIVDTVRVKRPWYNSCSMRTGPLSKNEHVRTLQRLKRILEADDPIGMEHPEKHPLLYTEL